MTFLKATCGVLIAVACGIAFFAMTDEYERARVAEPSQARVIEAHGGIVRYEIQSPGSQWDDDGDGWIGPYSDEVPEDVATTLSPGDLLTRRGHTLEIALAPPSKLLLVGLGLGLVFALWSIVAPIRERRLFAKAAADPQRTLELMVVKSRGTKLTSGVVMLGLGLPLLAAGLFLPGAALWERAVIAGLGLITVPIAGFAFWGAWKLRDPKQAPVIRALREEPQCIVWVYEHRIVVNGIANHNLYLNKDDGTRYELNLAQLDPTPLLQTLSRQLPHAAFGYTPDRERAYRAQPAGFLSAI